MKRPIVPSALLAPHLAKSECVGKIGADVGVVCACQIGGLGDKVRSRPVESQQHRCQTVAARIE
jgi:hypothetical protein